MMGTAHVWSLEFLINFDRYHFSDFEMLNPLIYTVFQSISCSPATAGDNLEPETQAALHKHCK
jgi:hypothetical protein